ncbi:MAG: BNR-4 repeat-containing protein [Phycisphaerae bacterium]|nr:BNR-4 repeat-containing protein [Phycisphaerae bacterium]
MKAIMTILYGVTPFVFLAAPLSAQQDGIAEQSPSLEHGLDWGIGGMGGVYFLPEPGELIVEVARRDRNRTGRPTELHAILFGPDRQVLAEKTIPDDGQKAGSGLGPVHSVRLSAQVVHRGVYGLNITASQDRYGEHVLWGFRTNCARYVVETARGHRDARHLEPIVLLRPDRPVDVAFLPRGGAFNVQIADLPPGEDPITMYDHKDQRVAVLKPTEDHAASHRFAADPARGQTPWRLHLPKGQATIEIEGVTSWTADDLYQDMACWSPERASWFPLLEHRWLLQPYRHLAYDEPEARGRFAFALYNNSRHEQRIRLQLEFPKQTWAAEISQPQVVVPARSSVGVEVRYTAPPAGEQRIVHLRATPTDADDFTTYATLTVRGGQAPAAQPLKMPIVLRPYEHENAQFGYAPDYPISNQVYFDLENRPFLRVPTGILTPRDGQWVAVEFTPKNVAIAPPLREVPRSISSTKIAFDADNDVYLLAGTESHFALLHSSDGGRSFRAYPIAGRENELRHFDIEQFSGHNLPDGPPPFVRYTRTRGGTERPLFWRRENDLDLFVPRKQDGRIVIGEPIRLSDMGLGLAMHSGPPATLVSRGERVHVCWGEATDPAIDVPGVPAFVVTYDREHGTLGEPARIGYGPPANDVHNTPSITIDSAGYLHAIVGTHGRPFLYTRSLQPNHAHGGWTEPVPTSQGARQTYVGMVCGADDTLHLVFRLWHSGDEPFPATGHGRLAYQRKTPNGDWEPPVSLVVPAFGEYSVYYHRLTIDQKGALFLSYEYWSTHWFYRNDQSRRTRAVLTSTDGGRQWRLW